MVVVTSVQAARRAVSTPTRTIMEQRPPKRKPRTGNARPGSGRAAGEPPVVQSVGRVAARTPAEPDVGSPPSRKRNQACVARAGDGIMATDLGGALGPTRRERLVVDALAGAAAATGSAGDLVQDGRRKMTSKTSPRKRDVVQVKNPRSGRYVKIDRDAGRIVSHKKSSGPYKGVPVVSAKKSA